MRLEQLDQRAGTALRWAAARDLRAGFIVLLVALVAVLPGLAALPVMDRDEARFAQATKQMLETGDFVDIRFQDAPRWKKPAGIYWLQAGAASMAGGAEAPIWAYRLPSALGVLGAALLLLWAARPLVGREAGLLAACMLPTCLLAMGEATIAKTDAMLLMVATAVFGGLVRVLPADRTAPASTVPDRPGPGPILGLGASLAFWAALGLAILLKGPIVPLVAALTLLTLWVGLRRPPPLGRLRPRLGALVVTVMVLPWLVAIWHVSEGRFFAESVGKDLLGKVAEGQEKHWGPPGLYIGIVWLTLWPWAALLLPTVPWVWQRWRGRAMLLVLGWVVPFWLILEAVPTKLPHYVLPLYPAMLAAMGACLLAPDRPALGPRQRWAVALLVAVPGVVLAAAIVALPAVLEGRVVWPAAVAAGLGAIAALIAARAALSGARLAQVAASLVAALLLGGATLQGALPALATGFPSPRIAEVAAQWRPCASGPLVSAGYREPSVVFLTETGARLATPEAAARALADDPGTLMLLERRWLSLLERHWPDGPPPYEVRATLSYFNYNRGDFEVADLVTPPGPRWAACAG